MLEGNGGTQMKRQIFLFHMVTLILALLILLAVGGGVLHLMFQMYQEQAVPAADSRAGQVQAALDGWPEGYFDWRELDWQLEELDYRLVVERDHRVLYSSLEGFQQELYGRISQDASWPESGTLALQDQGVYIVGRQCGDVVLVAMMEPQMPEMFGRPRPQNEAVLIAFSVSGLMAIAIIGVFSLLFARYQVRQILRPVNALVQAARRVEEGDLSTPVAYQGEDEFAPVCAAFDHMQQHLLEEREKNACYEQARTDLVAGISHDLRTPLTSVKGYLKGMRDGVANTPEKRKQYLDVAYRKACDMERLLQRLFYFSQLETGNLPLFPQTMDLGEFVEQFVRETRQELAPSGGRVELRGAPAPHPVRADPEQLLRVLNNLKDNAVRYAAGEGPLVLTLTVWRQRDRECIRFADNGPGVPEEQLPHLFEQFWRGDQARSSRGGEGSGLGLYIVKYIIEAHGGTIWARNDHGLVFEIALPCLEAE